MGWFSARGRTECRRNRLLAWGASQVLLAAGLKVVGIDPAEVDPLISENPNFRHIRKRSKDVSRREFNGVDWLTCDINLPPSYTLDTVESVVMHPKVRIRGLILTLKLIDWSLAAEIPAFVERVRGWGYSQVRVRQLHHNRQEVCLVSAVSKSSKTDPLEPESYWAPGEPPCPVLPMN